MFKRKPSTRDAGSTSGRRQAMRLCSLALPFLVGLYAPSAATAQTTDRQGFIRVLRGNLSEDQPAVSRVVATGVVNAVGTERFDADVPGDGASRQTFYFRDGTISTRAFDEQVDTSLDPRSCVGTLDVTGREEITSGSGAYAGASGSGSLTESGRLFASRTADGTCNEDDLSYVIVVRYTGTLTLPTQGVAR